MSYAIMPLRIQGVHHSYGSHPVLRGVDLDVSGGIHALLGPNGAGKTTMIAMASTLLRPDRGTVSVFGHDSVHDRRSIRRLIGVTGQDTALDPVLTGHEQLTMIGRLHGLSGRESRRRCEHLLERFDLTDVARRRSASYSGGLRRRLDLAATLVGRPRLVFLDEPTTGLDARSRQSLWDEVAALARAGTTVLLTTQYLEEADVLADRVSVLVAGRIVADATPSQLKASAGRDRLEVLDDRGRVTQTLDTDGTAAGVREAMAGLPDHTRVVVRPPTLDEAFLALTSAIGSGATASPGVDDRAGQGVRA